ncbi:nidogen-like domain-containing protein, partial [Planctomycetota bacterium]
PQLINCRIENNTARGGGISNNWQNELEISNCTIADNSLTGIYSFGGGLYGSYDSNTVVTDSIIWDNMAARGTQIALGSADPADPLPSSLTITNSNADLRIGEVTTLVDPDFIPVIRPGFNEFSLTANDDLSTGSVDIGFNINYFGSRTSTLFVNNNGNVTFDSPMWTFTPFALTSNLGTPVIAPFFADVDTRTGTIVTYGQGVVDGRAAFGINWIDVGYFASHVDKLNSFQLILIDRSDRAPGDFDIEFNYATLNWETGDASLGQDGFGGFSARAGFSHGTGNPGTYYEFEGSGVNGAFLNSNPNGLIYGSRNSSVPGRYIFTVSRGAVDIGLLDIPIYIEDGSTVAGWAPDDSTFPLDPNAPNDPWDPATNNIAEDPIFVAGYYLSQIASGQDFDSPSVDIGSGDVNDPGIGLGDYTTRTDGVNDVNIVDLGYHYNDGLLGYRLTAEVIEDPNDPNDPIHGSVDPNDKTIYVGFDNNVITVIATPDTGYKVKKWIGTDDDTLITWTNTVTLTQDRHVTVEFEEAEKFNLTVNVVETEGEGHGTVVPTSGSFFDGQTIDLITTPDPGYQVKAWTGTDDDTSTDLNNTVTINGRNAVVTVEFWQPVPAIISVPGDYQRIQDAVTAAKDGDTIVVDSGVYYGQDQSLSLVIDKAVHLTSRDPYDPCTVEATIIRGNFTISPWQNIGVIFAADATLNGFTIEDFGGNVSDGDDGDRGDGIINGVDGGSLDGAGIWVLSQTSPVIKNCVIRNNVINAGNGGLGVNADADNNAGRGGWGGYAHGAGIYCGAYSTPQLINCRIENNTARGGSGGNGGDYDAQGGYANYGGNFSREGSIIFPVIDYPTDPNITTFDVITEGHLWEIWGYDGDYRYYSGYGGGVFCDIGSNVTFENCEIRDNRSFGGMSGQGGVMGTAGRQIEPLVPYEIPSYGGGVYCAADSTVIFTGCTFEDNIASEADPNDPNHSLSPYMGYGGGVCAENSALVSFTDCNFVDNQADSGGGIY